MKSPLRFPLLTAALAATLLLGGCGSLLHSTYDPPQTDVPAKWQYAGPDNVAAGGDWWRDFHDDALNRLIDEVLQRNNDLAAATIKVRRAQLEAGLAANQMIPSLGADASVGHDKNLYGARSSATSYAASVNVSYEADLWGRLGSNRDAARWEALATQQDRDSTALSLVGTTAKLYWELAYLNQRIELSAASIAYAEHILQLVQVQHSAGAASALELLEAQQNLASQQASHTQLVQQRVETENAIAVLTDGPPRSIDLAVQRLPGGALPPVAAGLPADLLRRRPDLRAAELRLRESLAGVDATKASYYPTLTLTGALGSSSTALGSVLKNPVATLGAGLTLPFLQWREMQLSVAVSQSDYAEAVVNFRQTLYQALSDVENALSARTQYEAQGEKLQQSLAAARKVEQLYEVRYRAGAVSLQSWLEAQERRRDAEVSLAENRLDRLSNHVTLYLALGGGLSGE